MSDMNRLVWNDYWKALRWKNAWRKMRDFSGFIVVITQMFTIWPLNILDLEGEARVHYYILAFPLIFALFSSICVELELPKQMYLTPLTQVERREYMEKLLRLKLVIPNLVMGVVITAMLILKKTNIAWGLALLLQNILSTMGMSLFYKVEKSKNVKELQTEGNLFWAICTMVIGLGGEFYIMGGFSANADVESVYLVMFGVGVVFQLFCLYKMYSRKNQYFDRLANYERLYLKSEKKEVKSAW